MNALQQLKTLIRQEADRLTCDTHPHLCALRDESYLQLEEKVIAAITVEGEPPSVQTVLAEMETALAEAEDE